MSETDGHCDGPGAAKDDRLVALGVNQGDAFYLERHHGDGVFRALVDGGGNRAGLPKLLEKVGVKSSDLVSPPQLDVVVCTHNDFDHSNGLIGYFEHSLRANEVWLPGKLRHVLREMRRRPEGFTWELIEDVSRLDAEWLHLGPSPDGEGMLQAYGELLLDEDESQRRDLGESSGEVEHHDDLRAPDESRSDDELVDAICGAPDAGDVPFSLDYPRSERFRRSYFGPGPAGELLAAALEAGERTFKLARAALNAGATLHWFEYDATAPPSGGKPDLLHPLNAIERIRVRPWRGALREIALTTVNRESLVFHSPRSSAGAPAVIFSADSSFEFRPSDSLPWSDEMVVTAPHHGSEANKNVYDRTQSEARGLSLRWLRSDRRSKSRPATWYKRISGPRFCTICNDGRPKRDVALLAKAGVWRPMSGIHPCKCR